LQGHRQKEGDAIGFAFFVESHHPVEKPRGALFGGHLADIAGATAADLGGGPIERDGRTTRAAAEDEQREDDPDRGAAGRPGDACLPPGTGAARISRDARATALTKARCRRELGSTGLTVDMYAP
jgi:hypothetical protein